MDAKWISTLPTLVALCCCMTGCANRFQHAADKSLLIQENLQLDQALSITQYELMLAQQENDALRRQLEQTSQNPGGMSGNTSSGRLPLLRSQYESMGTAPTFDAHDPSLPPPSSQLPRSFQRPQQSPPGNYPPQPSVVPGHQTHDFQASAGTQYTSVPSGVPQWSPQRVR